MIDHWWQTETGWAIAANCWGIEHLPVKPGSPTKAAPGYDVRVLDEAGKERQPGEIGNIVVKLPLPPGNSPTLWQNDQRYVDSYLARYDGYYLTGDAGYRDEDGYLYVMSRIDDVINVAGHRLSTGAMEEVLAAHPDVAECAVFGVDDQLKGELPLGLVVLKAGVERPEAEICKGADPAGAPADRAGRRVQAGRGGAAPAQDPLRQDPARHHEERSPTPRPTRSRRRSTIRRSSRRSRPRWSASATPRPRRPNKPPGPAGSGRRARDHAASAGRRGGTKEPAARSQARRRVPEACSRPSRGLSRPGAGSTPARRGVRFRRA